MDSVGLWSVRQSRKFVKILLDSGTTSWFDRIDIQKRPHFCIGAVRREDAMKCKFLLCAVILGTLASGPANLGGNQGAAEAKKEKPKIDPAEEKLAELAKARREAVEKAYVAFAEKENNLDLTDTLYQLSIRWLTADLDLAKKKEDRVAAHGAHLKRMKDWEKKRETRTAPFITLVIRSFQREAEYWLAKESLGSK